MTPIIKNKQLTNYSVTSKIAEERIEILIKESEKKFEKGDTELSQRYIELAKRIGERTQTSIPREQKKKFCKKCNTYWKQGKNCKVTINSGKQLITYKCLECGETEKHGY